MASYSDQPRDLSTVPADPEVFGFLLAAAVVAFVLGVLFSGARWRQLPFNPWLWFRAAIGSAAAGREHRFWLTWVLFGFAVVFAAAAIVVGGVLLSRG